jgi:phosphotransferase system enzyme I (PtsI)
MIIHKGISASPGIAIAKAFIVKEDEIPVEKRSIAKSKIPMEVKRFKQALKKTHQTLDSIERKVLTTLGKKHARLVETHKLILQDPLLTQEVALRIASQGINAEYALSKTIERIKKHFEKIDDEFFRERHHDLIDVAKRLMQQLIQKERKGFLETKNPLIIVAHNLLPSDTLHLKERKVLAFCTDVGGQTSHTALLAKSMEIPAVVGLSDITKQVKNGDTLIVDGSAGIVIISPNAQALEKYRRAIAEDLKKEKSLEKVKNLTTITLDGKRTELMVNMDLRENIAELSNSTADGAGLLRTDYLSLNKLHPPSEKEHFDFYKPIVKAFAPHPVIIRLADLGGDKLSQFGLTGREREPNPFMGLRGIRLFLRYPQLMKSQLRAIIRASVYGNVRIMVPMVSIADEIKEVKKFMAACRNELIGEGFSNKIKIKLGIMVEVPSAIVMLDAMLGLVDFISIGTNDLIQYLMAVDRINQDVANIYQANHPAVLRMIRLAVEAAHKKGKPVSLCGEMASETNSIPLLLGMGIDNLSVTQKRFLNVRHLIRSLSFADCAELTRKALNMPGAKEVNSLVSSHLNENP